LPIYEFLEKDATSSTATTINDARVCDVDNYVYIALHISRIDATKVKVYIYIFYVTF
jgi:hypothetical protein